MEPDELRRAVAVGPGPESEDQRVLATGYGELAEAIIEHARRDGIYVHESPELVNLLMTLNLDERIPDALYQVVSELLVWVKNVDAALGGSDDK